MPVGERPRLGNSGLGRRDDPSPIRAIPCSRLPLRRAQHVSRNADARGSPMDTALLDSNPPPSHRRDWQGEALRRGRPRTGNTGVRGRARPSPGSFGPLLPQPPDRGRCPSGSSRAAATGGSGGGLGPPPIHLLPLSRRRGEGFGGVRAVPASPATRREDRFRSDTSPCQPPPRGKGLGGGAVPPQGMPEKGLRRDRQGAHPGRGHAQGRASSARPRLDHRFANRSRTDAPASPPPTPACRSPESPARPSPRSAGCRGG